MCIRDRQQTLRVAEHTIAQRHDISGEFEFLHCICKTKPTGDAEGWEARDLVRRAMACLPERQREVLHLKDIEGYPTREIAEIAACDEAQVRVILSRARNGLREVLKKMMDDERAGRKN